MPPLPIYLEVKLTQPRGRDNMNPIRYFAKFIQKMARGIAVRSANHFIRFPDDSSARDRKINF